jgi:hypothetical protein
MTQDRTEGGRSPVMVMAGSAVAILLLPLAYLVSSGPVEWLMAHGYVSYDNPYVEAFYYPGERLMEACPPINALVRWWLSLWK